MPAHLRSVLLVSAALGVEINGPARAADLFSEDYASGATTTTALVPSTIVNGGASATPVFEIEPFIVNPAFNGGSSVGPNLLTFDPQAPNPEQAPEGFQAIDFAGAPHPNDPAGYEEITASGNWWTDTPTTFFHQNASIDLTPTMATRNKVYVLDYSVASNLSGSSTESTNARIGLFDAQDQGVYLSHTYNNRAAADRFRRTNQINVHRINSAGENVHIEVDDTFTTAAANIGWGETLVPTTPTLDFNDFRFRAEDDTGILSHFFQYEAVLRLHELDFGRLNLEWFSPDAIPADPADDASTPFGGSPGARPEKDGWHNLPIIENVFDLSGSESQPLGDIATLRLSLWNPSYANGDGTPQAVTVSNLDEVDTSNVGNRSTNNHQIGFGRIAVREYHVGDLNRDGVVTAEDVTGAPLLGQLGTEGERVWGDGDTTGDNDITVGDALFALTGAAGALPQGPELVYNAGTGEVQIVTGGAALSGFSLIAADEDFADAAFNNPASGAAISTERGDELSWMNLTTNGTAAGSNLGGAINLGAVLPTGLSDEQFEAFFESALFNVDDALSRSVSFFGVDGLPGDYNGDGVVDAADYTVWRDGGAPDSSQAGYDLWANNFGAASAAAAGVPEPSAGCVALTLVLASAVRARGEGRSGGANERRTRTTDRQRRAGQR